MASYKSILDSSWPAPDTTTVGGVKMRLESGEVALEKPDRLLFKFLTADGTSPYQYARWPLPKKNADGTWTPGAWKSDPVNTLITCQKGLHMAYLDSDTKPTKFMGSWGADRLFLVEVEGGVLHSKSNDKCVARKVRLVREIEGYAAVRGGPEPEVAHLPGYQDWARARVMKAAVDYARQHGQPSLASEIAKASSSAEVRAVFGTYRREATLIRARAAVVHATAVLEALERGLPRPKTASDGKSLSEVIAFLSPRITRTDVTPDDIADVENPDSARSYSYREFGWQPYSGTSNARRICDDARKALSRTGPKPTLASVLRANGVIQ